MVIKTKIIAIALASTGILGAGAVATVQKSGANINGSEYSEEKQRETDLRKNQLIKLLRAVETVLIAIVNLVAELARIMVGLRGGRNNVI